MIPGPQRICQVVPQVRMALKMQKINIEQRYFYGSDFLISLRNIARQAKNEEEDCKKTIELFTIFLKKEFDYEQVRQGVENTGVYINKIRKNRTDPNPSKREQQIFKEKQQFLDNKIHPKIQEIYIRREIPKFSTKTRGELNFNPELGIIDENNLEFKNNLPLREITVFKFRDKNGRLSLNFYAPVNHCRYGRRR